MEYVNIMEAAQHCGVSDKTIRRWIHAGKLAAQYPQPNRCEIALSDLETFKPGQMSGQVPASLESRIATLEQRVQGLERLLRDLQAGQDAPSRRRVPKARERTTGPLPGQLSSLLAFAGYHNVAESKVLAAIDKGLLPVKRGAWTNTDGMVVTLALDAKGRSAFSQLYHDVPPFVPCTQCPHEDI